jgi:hypothetical protein
MAKQINPDKSEKFEIVFEKEDSTHVWKYDYHHIQLWYLAK